MSQMLDHHAIRANRSVEFALGISLVLIFLTSAVFMAAPELDIKFSALFYDASGFPIAENAELQLLRAVNDWIGAIILGFAFVLLNWTSYRDRIGIPARELLLPLFTYGIGVGLIVNVFLKGYFGRARPRDILEFGGDDLFTIAWQASNACQSNCSFTSGEAAGAMAIYSALVLLPGSRPVARIVCGICIGCFAVALGLSRIAFGAHFLSDVLLSMLIVLAVMLFTKLLLRKIVSKLA